MLVAILTDFGYRDPYAGIMKAVMSEYDPSLRFIDLTHGIPPFDLRSAAYVLSSAWPYLPRGTVVLVVVDPGVGTSRREVIAEGESRCVVAPDNGVVSLLLERAETPLSCYRARDDVPATLSRSRPAYATTFDGRDLFAPLAARIASNGVATVRGAAVTPERLPKLRPNGADSGGETRLEGHAVHIDTFGNVVTTITAGDLTAAGIWDASASTDGTGEIAVKVETARGWVQVPFGATFGDVAPGRPIAYIGSAGHLETAVREGDFAATYGVAPAAPVVVSRRRSG
ncbi:MAG: S-adenosyl-l-methionine hydroxide adenosyltransferase family protein, partial [Spirochaetaceae bacterium]